ncbi:DNA polymerase IV, partial [Pediococcus acidilactici]|nr:DNA polymerase IV [Pediococcus acidilactici]
TLYRRVRGQDDRPVAYQRERKSIGKEETYGKPLVTENEVDQRLHLIAKKLAQAVTKRQKHGKTLVLKLRYRDFETLTKRITRPEFLPTDSETYYFYAKQIFDEIADFSRGIRLLGITITNLSDQSFQEVSLPLFKHED